MQKVLAESCCARFGNNHMSRIGNTPIEIPKDVAITVNQASVVVKGPKGELVLPLSAGITVKHEGTALVASRKRRVFPSGDGTPAGRHFVCRDRGKDYGFRSR